MKEIQFTKMEGAGNDYVYLDGLDSAAPELNQAQRAQLADRHFGVGSDGVIILAPSSVAAVKMLMWNSDGTSSAMCGNALRCVAFLTAEKNNQTEFLVESETGVHKARILKNQGESGYVEINMGGPRFQASEIPLEPQKLTPKASATDAFINQALHVEGLGEFRATFVSMGNPHCVIFVPDADALNLEQIGPQLEHHPAFPERMNIEFVTKKLDGSLYQRTHERGSGETLACGSGACAVLVASVLAENGPGKNRIQLRGGELELEWTGSISEPGEVIMRGPVRKVFSGKYYLK